MDKNENVGIVTEQGDLGLGFSVITESEKKILAENEENNKQEK